MLRNVKFYIYYIYYCVIKNWRVMYDLYKV